MAFSPEPLNTVGKSADSKPSVGAKVIKGIVGVFLVLLAFWLLGLTSNSRVSRFSPGRTDISENEKKYQDLLEARFAGEPDDALQAIREYYADPQGSAQILAKAREVLKADRTAFSLWTDITDALRRFAAAPVGDANSGSLRAEIDASQARFLLYIAQQPELAKRFYSVLQEASESSLTTLGSKAVDSWREYSQPDGGSISVNGDWKVVCKWRPAVLGKRVGDTTQYCQACFDAKKQVGEGRYSLVCHRYWLSDGNGVVRSIDNSKVVEILTDRLVIWSEAAGDTEITIPPSFRTVSGKNIWHARIRIVSTEEHVDTVYCVAGPVLHYLSLAYPKTVPLTGTDLLDAIISRWRHSRSIKDLAGEPDTDTGSEWQETYSAHEK